MPVLPTRPGQSEDPLDSTLATGPYAGLTLGAALAALGHRWQAEKGAGAEAAQPGGAPFAFTPAAARARLSERGYWLIIDHQTGGRGYYERTTRSAPWWPGGGGRCQPGHGL